MNPYRRRPRRSLQTILSLWLLAFSVVPLAVVSWYSVRRYEQSLDRELVQRLRGNSREVESIFNDIRSGLQQKRDRYLRDANLKFALTDLDEASLRQFSSDWVRSDFANSLSFFDRNGKMLVTSFRDERGTVRSISPSTDAVFLSEKYLLELSQQEETSVVEFSEGQKVSLLLIARILNSSSKPIGYLEQRLDLDQKFLARIKSKLKLEVFFVKDTGQVLLSGRELPKISKDALQGMVGDTSGKLLDVSYRGDNFGFSLFPVNWGANDFYIALGVSKAEAKELLQNIRAAFLTVAGTLLVVLVITILFSSRLVLKPLYELVEALQSFENQEQAVTISVKNDTEIGLLTESFNQMSLKIWQARSELEKKVDELETANKEIRETQKQLVHSAKMVSLGQLVAGVAHELNNPIGFIYSNMSHLQEYTDKLVHLVEAMEKNKKLDLKEAKEEFDFDYIKEDLPKLIKSCQDGARRTRDIVVGLRNFSRLDEAKLTELDVQDSLDTTLALLQGEIKNRIEIHKSFEPLPRVLCYGNQINQVFMNILSNAIQAIEGSGHIWLATHTLVDGSKHMVSVSIQDSGKGIRPENIDKIFDPFFSTKKIGQGTGLGLSISYGIISKHGGDIQVRSEPGVGTEFVITLPIDGSQLSNDASDLPRIETKTTANDS